jgi:hypothetical protein
MDVGMLFAVALPAGVKESVLVRLIVRAWPVGTVITTGDQEVAVARKVASEPWKVQTTVPSLVVAPAAVPHDPGAADPLVPAVVTACTLPFESRITAPSA